MDALEWVKKTFKPRLMRKAAIRDDAGNVIEEKEVETTRILIRKQNGGEFYIEADKFARLFKDEIEGNKTNKKKLAAMKSKKVTRKVRDPETNTIKDVEATLGFEDFLSECEKEGLFK